jgi:lipoprotein-anchoring transpeptidase ErfK/SrfK
MPTKQPPKPGRLALLLILGAALLMAGMGAISPGLARLSSAFGDSHTPTPTKTPHPGTPAPVVTLIEPSILPHTPTPRPTFAPTTEPTGQAQAGGLTPFLVGVVAQYGMDPARRFIVVDPDRQLMIIWDPGHPVRELPVSTGDEARGYRTPAWYGLVGRYTGTFQAFGVSADEGWYLFEDLGSILVHGAPYTVTNGVKQYLGLDALGNYPASRGCIRLRPEDAAWFTEWGPRGVPLAILPRATH